MKLRLNLCCGKIADESLVITSHEGGIQKDFLALESKSL